MQKEYLAALRVWGLISSDVITLMLSESLGQHAGLRICLDTAAAFMQHFHGTWPACSPSAS